MSEVNIPNGKKWGNISESTKVDAYLYFLALDEFNIPNLELETSEYKTKLDLAFAVFEETMNSIENGCRILFLNKVDLFEKKLGDKEKFSEFKKILEYDGRNSLEDCTRFLQEKLIAKLNNKNSFHVHITNALDTQLLGTVSDSIKEAILSSHSEDFGII